MVAANPQNADAYLLRAQFLLNDKDPTTQADRLKQATADCDKVVALQPDHADGSALAAMCAQQNAQQNSPENKEPEKSKEGLSKAREYLRKSIGIKPNVPQRYMQLANLELLANAGDRAAAGKAAMDAIREGIAAIPDTTKNFDLRWRLADLLISSGQKDDAKVIKEVRELQAEMKKEKPDSPLIAYLEARQLYMDEKWFEAQQILENIRGGLSQRPDLRMRADEMLGRCYAQLGDTDLQLTACRHVLDENPLDIRAHKDYAEALISVGRWPEAIHEYDQILSMLGAKVPLEIFKRYFFLKFRSTLRQPRVDRDWASLMAMLKGFEEKVPNDPWFPIMRAEVALAEEKDAASKIAEENSAEPKKTVENAEEPKKVEKTLEAAKVAQGPTGTAKEILAAARANMPTDLSVWMASIELAQRQENNEEVEQLLEDTEKKFGDTVDVRMFKARRLSRLNSQKDKEGVSDSPKDKKGVPDFAEFAQNLAKDISTADRLQLYWQLARLYSSEGDPVQGLAYGRQAAQLAPNNLPIRMALLRMALNAKDVPTAEQLAGEIAKIEIGLQTTDIQALAAEIKKIDRRKAVTLYSLALCDLTRYAANEQDTAANEQDTAANEQDTAANEQDKAALQRRAHWLQQAAQETPDLGAGASAAGLDRRIGEG